MNRQSYRQRLADMLLRHGNRPTFGNPANPDHDDHYRYQPRVPPGHPDGGQWTRGGGQWTSRARVAPRRTVTQDPTGKETWKTIATDRRPDGSIAEQLIINRDGSQIRSQYAAPGANAGWDERHTVRTRDGQVVTFENSGLTQTIYDAQGRQVSQTVMTKDGPRSVMADDDDKPLLHLARGPSPADSALRLPLPPHVKAVIAVGAAILYEWMLRQNSPEQKAVLAFRAHNYEIQGIDTPEARAVWVGRITEEEVKKACERYKLAKSITNLATAKIRADRKYSDEADFGMKVHKEIEREVKGIGNPNFLAEEPLWRMRKDDPRQPVTQDPDQDLKRGKRDSIQVDILDNNQRGTVCVYDPKVEKQRMRRYRFDEIAASVFHHFKNVHSIIVVEIKPDE
jgi:hypothetical protein